MKKIKKFIESPGVFFRDYFNKKYPKIYNEVSCPQEEEEIIIRHGLVLDDKLNGSFPIDIVFTWVNGNDPEWIKKYKKFKSINIESHGQHATNQARFSDHNELYYSISSIIKYLPWVEKIYLITDSQIPSWIKEFQIVKIIDHKEIIPKEYLPTFNSHVIEAHLHKIPNLAEHFIYFNDDVFVARPLPKGHFFKSNGLASLFLSDKSYQNMVANGIITPTLSASLKVSLMLSEILGFRIDTPLVHTYIPLRKSMFDLVEKIYAEEIASFLPNKFRTNEDLNVATCLVPWYSYAQGYSTPERDICYYFNIRSPVAKNIYKSLYHRPFKHSPHSFCANDVVQNTQSEGDYVSKLKKALNYYYYFKK